MRGFRVPHRRGGAIGRTRRVEVRDGCSADVPMPDPPGQQLRSRAGLEVTPDARPRAIYSDIRARGTFWMDDIRAVGANDAEAISRALTTLIQDIGGAG